jgi:hypothetical protein
MAPSEVEIMFSNTCQRMDLRFLVVRIDQWRKGCD